MQNDEKKDESTVSGKTRSDQPKTALPIDVAIGKAEGRQDPRIKLDASRTGGSTAGALINPDAKKVEIKRSLLVLKNAIERLEKKARKRVGRSGPNPSCSR